MNAKTVGDIQRWLDIPDVRYGIEASGLNGNRADDIRLKIRYGFAGGLSDGFLNSLEAVRCIDGRDDVSLQPL
jgi:hypothetical protein